jgi:hypothetical protein
MSRLLSIFLLSLLLGCNNQGNNFLSNTSQNKIDIKKYFKSDIVYTSELSKKFYADTVYFSLIKDCNGEFNVFECLGGSAFNPTNKKLTYENLKIDFCNQFKNQGIHDQCVSDLVDESENFIVKAKFDNPYLRENLKPIFKKTIETYKGSLKECQTSAQIEKEKIHGRWYDFNNDFDTQRNEAIKKLPDGSTVFLRRERSHCESMPRVALRENYTINNKEIFDDLEFWNKFYKVYKTYYCQGNGTANNINLAKKNKLRVFVYGPDNLSKAYNFDALTCLETE